MKPVLYIIAGVAAVFGVKLLVDKSRASQAEGTTAAPPPPTGLSIPATVPVVVPISAPARPPATPVTEPLQPATQLVDTGLSTPVQSVAGQLIPVQIGTTQPQVFITEQPATQPVDKSVYMPPQVFITEQPPTQPVDKGIFMPVQNVSGLSMPAQMATPLLQPFVVKQSASSPVLAPSNTFITSLRQIFQG